jgi:ABC-type glycerol-3-phosphate transport system substrate-binding protein
LLVTAIMVGCAAPAAAPDAAAPGDDAAAATGEKTKIVWWGETVDPALEAAFQEQFVDAFNAANPDIELEVILQENLNEVLRTAIQAKRRISSKPPAPASCSNTSKPGWSCR